MEQSEVDTENAMTIPPKRRLFGWFEETIPVRGLKLSLSDVKAVYEELSAINRKFGEDVISTLQRDPEMSDDEWAKQKRFLLEDAFCLTISIRGERDQQFYGEDAEVFTSDKLPSQIRTIFFTNVTAWRRHSNGTDPENRMEIFLDFSKPALFDPNPFVSDPTPNDSNVTVRAQDMTYFRAVQRVVDTKLLNRKTWYAVIHRSFAYDVGMWTIALPAGLILASFYMDQWLPVDGDFSAYRWAFFIYALGMVVLGYRFLTGYAKWAFPVNVLAENKDKALRHRIALAGIFAWLTYKATDAIYAALPFVP
ncbi:hypothetical protein [Tateyamaria sp. ANG-S1]|uniref:hypothetical protein n=1 Tax=Tateyamaria sp. ANG-S1 TaxID=1577905 RepID=UPI00058081F5|nr:hypothetical protein [Tateyamaria sp. ANG-S1]KIC45430.1 hypothetical protein RA29_20965 [Tateyamaria sp. ANG-S1]